VLSAGILLLTSRYRSIAYDKTLSLANLGASTECSSWARPIARTSMGFIGSLPIRLFDSFRERAFLTMTTTLPSTSVSSHMRVPPGSISNRSAMTLGIVVLTAFPHYLASLD